MATFPRLVGLRQALACMLLLAVPALSFAETNYIAGLRQSSLLNAGNGLAEGDSQAQLHQLKQAFLTLAMERQARIAARAPAQFGGRRRAQRT